MERKREMTSLFSCPTLPAKVTIAVAPMFSRTLLKRAREHLRIEEDGLFAETLLALDNASLQRIGFTEERCFAWRAWRAQFDIDRVLTLCEREEIQLLFDSDPLYPPLLQQTHAPPQLLFVRGMLSTAPAIAIVGSRRCTRYGQEIATRFGSELAQQGCVVVSGLALGIDGYAHRGALDVNGLTHAIVANGLDEASWYPREHVRLANEILSKNGCLLSEQPPGIRPRRESFPIRNRLIAGFSLATVVIEAVEKSGSLITARLALEENREVLAVPGPLFQPTSRGPHLLIQAGAMLCTSVTDIFRAIALDQPKRVAEARDALPLNPEEKALLLHLTEPRTTEYLAKILEKTPGELLSALSLLELKGLAFSPEPDVWLCQKKPSLSTRTESML
jgi:DNA processing protein